MASEPNVWTVVVAGGSGLRFGAAKQYLQLAGQRVVDRSLAVAADVCDGVVAVVPVDDVTSESARMHADAVVAGGASRADSVRAGLAAVPVHAEIICVHDAARPLATRELYERAIAAVTAEVDGVVPTVPVTDTIRHVTGGVVERSHLLAVQTPQAFRAAALRAAHADEPDATDDAGLVEAAGGIVVTVEGEHRNIKITRPDDLLIAHAWLTDQ